MRYIRKILLGLVAILVVAAMAVFIYLQYLQTSLNDELTLKGLKDKVEVLYDNYGIPHIYANNQDDLFQAFGYVHARDRLFQMEILRRLADGRLSEVFGDKALPTDKFFRTLSLREHARMSIDSLYQDSTLPYVKAAKAYLRGVNQYLDQGKTPIEFTLAGIPKQHFTMEDMLVVTGYMGYTFVGTFKTETIASYIYDALGPQYYNDVMQQWPDSNHRIAVQAGEKRNADSAMKVLAMMTQQIEQLSTTLPYPAFHGSNGWVLSGQKTKSGKPILSNDTHMAYAQPSVWYEAYLECTGYSVYGNFVAGVALPALGHTAHGAWGLTMFENDDADLYREKANPQNPNQVWYKDHWEPLQIRKEIIKVKGKADEILEVKKSRHGYILNGAFEDIDHIKEPIAFWWIFHQFANRHPQVFYNLTIAKDVKDAANAIAPLTSPGLNFMWADVKRNIGWWAAGKLPIRPAQVDPQRILDGSTGNDDILGWYDFSFNPQIINPERGVLYSANNQPEDMGKGLIPGYYVPSDRAARIEELLFNDKKDWTEEELRKVINDVQGTGYAKMLKQILPLIKRNELTPTGQQALSMLEKWNGDHQLNQVEPTIFYRFIYQVIENTFRDELDLQRTYEFQNTYAWKRNMEHFMVNDSSAWWDNVKTMDLRETRAAILTSSLEQSVQWLVTDLGKDIDKWTWNKVHTIEHKHPLGVIPGLGKFFNVGPIPVNGGRETLNNLIFSLDSTGRYPVTAGPALRRIIDMADPSIGYSVNPTGQSGYFLSKHYDDQARMFAEGGKRPELTNRQSVEKVLKGKTVFKP